MTWEEAEAGGAEIADVAVGPAFGESGFVEIADIVFKANASRLKQDGTISLVINRGEYWIKQKAEPPTLAGLPLYRAYNEGDELMHKTLLWLHDQFIQSYTFLDMSLPRTVSVPGKLNCIGFHSKAFELPSVSIGAPNAFGRLCWPGDPAKSQILHGA